MKRGKDRGGEKGEARKLGEDLELFLGVEAEAEFEKEAGGGI